MSNPSPTPEALDAGALLELDREIEAALRQAGPPYRLVAVAAKCEGAAGVRVEVMALGVLVTFVEGGAELWEMSPPGGTW